MLESGRVHVDLVYRGGGCRRRALARGGPLAELGISPAGCPAAESSMAAADFPSLLIIIQIPHLLVSIFRRL